MVRDEAWAAWIDDTIRRFEEPLLLYASRLTGNAEEAQDVVQEIFLRLCAQDRSAIENHLNVWLFSVCRNYAFELRRRRSRLSSINAATEDLRLADYTAGEDVVEQQESYAEVLNELAMLPANQQEVIRLKFQHGLSYREISAVTKLTVTNVGFLMHVGLKKIRERLVGQVRELHTGK
jgi:RNA polymerase sigma factor (sigma-70 family)